MKHLTLILFLLVCVSCQEANKEQRTAKAKTVYRQYTGETMGTFYSVDIGDKSGENFKKDIEKLLVDVNASLSTYIPTSIISKVNQSKGKMEVDAYFARCFEKAKEINLLSNGAFDPTVMPLVNFWGFGYEQIPNRDEKKLADLRKLIGFRNWRIERDVPNYKLFVQKGADDAQIDFSGIAKGLGVDVIGEFLEDQGVRNYLVNIGGEVRARGNNKEGSDWNLGVNLPVEDAALDDIVEIVGLMNMSMATSGNYRNFKIIDGKKVVHTINPSTGRPEISNLLSASIITHDCMTADALATACMVKGEMGAKQILNDNDSVEGILIYSNANGDFEVWKSRGLRDPA